MTMLTGSPPLPLSTLEPLSLSVSNAYSATAGWRRLRSRPKDFITSLLELDETKRLTAQQALDHFWFSSETLMLGFQHAYLKAVKHWKADNLSGVNRIEAIPASHTPIHNNEEVRQWKDQTKAGTTAISTAIVVDLDASDGSERLGTTPCPIKRKQYQRGSSSCPAMHEHSQELVSFPDPAVVPCKRKFVSSSNS